MDIIKNRRPPKEPQPMDQLKQVTSQLAGYGELIANVMMVMVLGMVVVVLLYKLANKLIKPGGAYARAMKVVFGALYAEVLVVTVLVAAEKIGLPIAGLAGPIILAVIVIAVIVFFIVPFLPRIPFAVGDMVQIRDVLGTVEAITAYQIVVRTFDGQTVFMPTAMVMASSIRNYSLIPERRVQLDVDIYSQDDIEAARALLLEAMGADERVLEDPAPAVFVTSVSGEKATMVAYCWVKNADWFGTRDALWVSVSRAFADNAHLRLAIAQLDVSPARED